MTKEKPSSGTTYAFYDYNVTLGGKLKYKTRSQFGTGTNPMRPDTRLNHVVFDGKVFCDPIKKVTKVTISCLGITIFALSNYGLKFKMEHFDIWGFPGGVKCTAKYFMKHPDIYMNTAAKPFALLILQRYKDKWEETKKYPLHVMDYE